MNDLRRKACKIKEIFSFYRGAIVDVFESELGSHPNWKYIRGRLLKFLSDERGLEAKVLETVLEGDKEGEAF